MKYKVLLEIEGPAVSLIKRSIEPDLPEGISLKVKNMTLLVEIKANRVSRLRALVNSFLRTVQVLLDIYDEIKNLQ